MTNSIFFFTEISRFTFIYINIFYYFYILWLFYWFFFTFENPYLFDYLSINKHPYRPECNPFSILFDQYILVLSHRGIMSIDEYNIW